MRDSPGPLGLYLQRFEKGELLEDEYQFESVKILEGIYDNIIAACKNETVPEAIEPVGWLSTFFSPTPSERRQHFLDSVPKGVYIYGSPGSGKTYLMDLLYDCLPDNITKRRVHFNSFMLNVHQRLHRWRQANGPRKDPIPPIADELAEEASVLCFDEFQVTEVGDAMILQYLFTELFQRRVTVIATSNRPPDDLYKDGVQRDRFIPFIRLLQRQCPELVLDSGIDYRFGGQKGAITFFHPHNSDTEAKLDEFYKSMCKDKWPPVPCTLKVAMGRELFVPSASAYGPSSPLQIPPHRRGVACFSFPDLCEQPLGAADYIALSENFHTLILKNIPKMNLDKRAALRRFITLVDELYQHHVKLVCSAGAPVDRLFEAESESSYDEVFAFGRCSSRLHEMQTKEYLQKLHELQKPKLKIFQGKGASCGPAVEGL